MGRNEGQAGFDTVKCHQITKLTTTPESDFGSRSISDLRSWSCRIQANTFSGTPPQLSVASTKSSLLTGHMVSILGFLLCNSCNVFLSVFCLRGRISSVPRWRRRHRKGRRMASCFHWCLWRTDFLRGGCILRVREKMLLLLSRCSPAHPAGWLAERCRAVIALLGAQAT
ncbi:hypothetical protein VTK56DRAFT_599 [Thermocarpiscus australiensis]